MADAQTTEAPDGPDKDQRKWMREIERAEKYFHDWYQKADKIIQLYRKQGEQQKSKRRFAMLWANTEVLKPTVYAKTPEPAVSRRYKDQDPVGRVASDILERSASYQFECGDIDDTLKAARDDLLLPGRGAAWVRFLESEKVVTDYIHWRDFLHEPARRWKDVTWVAKRSYLTKAQMGKRFPAIKGKLSSLSPDNIPRSSGLTDEEKKAIEGKYSVWEIWDKTSNKVIFISPTSPEPLDMVDPFLTLEGFWPTVKPLYATITTDSLVPVPDYKYYQDQAEEIDDLTRRIASLTDSLKIVGFYPGGAEDTAAIERALKPEVENEMIKVESWAAFSEKGGTGGVIFLPMKQVADTIVACVELRRQLIEDVYQITGISDIMRGSTNPDETLGAQQLKAQNGSIRVRDRQQEIQRFARDLTRIMCEIIAEKFQPATLLAMTNMNTPENNTPEKKTQIMQAFQLMKDDKLRGFRIDIETDSTIQPDEQAEKEARIEFVTAIGSFLKEALPVAQQVPEMLPMLGETLRFVVRGFRTGRQLEDVIDKTIQQLEQKAQMQAQQPPQPSPEEIKAQAIQQKAQTDVQVAGTKMQMDQQAHQQDMQFKQASHVMDIQQKQALAHQQIQQQAQQANQQLRQDDQMGQQNLRQAQQQARLRAAQPPTRQ
jgi:hypothetical protein